MTAPSDTTRRLHITPFTPDLLPAVLGALKSSATEISFHHIPTFPENNYGYVTLPAMDAEKVKKKLNGSILKGRKFKVETARPQKRHRDEDDAEPAVAEHKPPKEKKHKKKRKDEFSVFEGYELPPDRQVKRGWTESSTALKERRKDEKKRKEKEDKKTKSQSKSKYTEKSECLFRTKLPPNRSSADEKSEKTKKKKKPAQESVVHEFSKTISHPSFIRSGDDGSKPTSTFEEGKGWVDSSGNVKEEASSRVKSDKYQPGKVPGAKEKRKAAKVDVKKKSESKKAKAQSPEESTEESEDWTSSSGESSSDESSSDSESEISASSISSDESDVSSSDDEQVQKTPSKEKVVKDAGSNQKQDTTGTDNEPRSEVHPLEALFKRPAPDSTSQNPEPEANAQFSFFGQGDIEESEEETEQPVEPHTPFTKNDLQARGLRSAAPTPDTALVGKTIKWTTAEDESMDVDDELYANTPVPKGASPVKEESEFTKWFWENRGDNNRAWKKRRRDAAKEQRQRENRSKGMRGKS